jgi:glycosyltransferase involved in cell wall biosynthesis
MPLLLVSPLGDATGNRSTATRLAALLARLSPAALTEQLLVDSGAPDAGERVGAALAATARPHLCVALHAYKAGRHVVDCCGGQAGDVCAPGRPPTAVPPVVLVLGGTDINHDVADALHALAARRAGADAACDPLPEHASRADYIAAAVRLADAVVAFTPAMAARYTAFVGRMGALGGSSGSGNSDDDIGRLRAKLRVIPQGVDLGVGGLALAPSALAGDAAWERRRGAAAVAYDTGEASDQQQQPPRPPPPLREVLGLPPSARLLVLVAGVRAVKDPLFLAGAVAAWHAAAAATAAAAGGEPPVHMVIVGPVLEPALFERVRQATGCSSEAEFAAAAASAPPATPVASAGADAAADAAAPTAARPCYGGRGGLWYHPPVPRSLLLGTWLRHDADVLLNSSHTEGQCGALLEAMALGVPVVARHNEGNDALVAHGVTGLLYHTPDEAVAHCRALLAGRRTLPGGGSAPNPLRDAITAAAAEEVRRHHSVEGEAAAWARLLAELRVPVAVPTAEAVPRDGAPA